MYAIGVILKGHICMQYYKQSSSGESGSWALPIRCVCVQGCGGVDRDQTELNEMRDCRWMAPESYFDGTWDLRTDVWMFCVLLWGMCMNTGQLLHVSLTL